MSINTHEYTVRVFHIKPAEIPINRYRTLHTIAKTFPGGVSEDFIRVGYHVTNDSRCKSMDIYPTRNEINTNCRIGTKAFMVINKKIRVTAPAITLINITYGHLFI